MTLLDELPKQEQFTGILGRVIGKESDGTGVAGVLKLLQSVDTSALSSSAAGRLSGSVSATVSVDPSSLNGGALGQFQAALGAIPTDPGQLVGPLVTKLSSLGNLSGGDLTGSLSGALTGLQNAQALTPGDPTSLVSAAAAGIQDLKSELGGGAFDELRQWGTQVEALAGEIEPIFAGPGDPGDRLLEYLATKIAELIKAVLPEQKSLADQAAAALDAAISPNRVGKVQSLKAQVIDHMRQAQAAFAGGNFADTTQLQAALASFGQLTAELDSILTALEAALNGQAATPAGLSASLASQLSAFTDTEVVDLANIRQKFKEAVDKILAGIQQLHLDAVSKGIQDTFDTIGSAFDEVNLGQFAPQMAKLQDEVQSAADALDGELLAVVASIRHIFTQIKQALESAASALGTFDDQGKFHFKLETELESFLNGVKTGLHDTILPILDNFKNTVGQALQQVQAGLNAVKAQIDSVKTDLQAALKGVGDKLAALDVPGKLEEVSKKLADTLGELGNISFDAVVDPVVAEINDMAGKMQRIDVSSLNEIAVGALKVSVQVVVHVDFSAQISSVVLAELDKVLQLPKDALKDLAASVKAILDRFAALGPEVLLKPLDDLFAPVKERLDAFELDKLLAPIEAWYDSVTAEMDKISPAALLQPVVDAFDKLNGAFQAVSPSQLLKPVQDVLDGLKVKIQGLNLGPMAAELTAAVQQVEDLLDRFSPAALLEPLVSPFDKITETLDGFDPAALLKPVTGFFDHLADPLDKLTAAQVTAIGTAFAPLAAVPTAYDPQENYQATQQKYAQVAGLVGQLNVAGIMADLKTPFDTLQMSVQAGGADLSASVEGLNPLHDATLGRVAAGMAQVQSTLQTAFAQAQPPDDLLKVYAVVQPKLSGLIPSWINEHMTVDSVKAAVRASNPLNIGADLNRLWDGVKQQVRNFNPRQIQAGLQTAYDKVKAAILALDPSKLVADIQKLIDTLTSKLNTLDLKVITDELDGLAKEIGNLIGGLDPRPVLQALDRLAGEVRVAVEALKPAEVLGELQAPLDAAKGIVADFDPETFRAPLQDAFSAIEDILSKIDLAVILQPLRDELQSLRDELAVGLQRAEFAFNDMLKAIPV